jgi:hypothetical protein
MTDFQKAIKREPQIYVNGFVWIPMHVWVIANAWQYLSVNEDLPVEWFE